MARTLRQEIVLIPNILTMFRIVLIPAILVYIDNESLLRSFIAMILCAVCAATDFLDGYLARRSKQISLLGKFLDPLADKLLVMSALVWMVPLGRVDAWIVILLLGREISITGLRGIASAQGLIISARQMGKDKTALQFIGILALIVHFRYPIIFTDYYIDFHQVGIYTIYISLVFSIFSALEYVQLFARAVEAQSGKERRAVGQVDLGHADASASDQMHR
jgi:CDP-diacylglycerol--glycerol-3-phosphate 3-phosphatidyltransferase